MAASFKAPGGDVNCDEAVDITDVLFIIDFIFGTVPTEFQLSAANLDDSNQQIDITDLLMVIDIIFGI